jgi:hypothetical protein
VDWYCPHSVKKSCGQICCYCLAARFRQRFFKQKKQANFFANLYADSALGGWSGSSWFGLYLMCETKLLLLLAFFEIVAR